MTPDDLKKCKRDDQGRAIVRMLRIPSPDYSVLIHDEKQAVIKSKGDYWSIQLWENLVPILSDPPKVRVAIQIEESSSDTRTVAVARQKNGSGFEPDNFVWQESPDFKIIHPRTEFDLDFTTNKAERVDESISTNALNSSTTLPSNLNDYAKLCHEANAHWWHDENGNRIERNKGELLCLIHSEISELMEGERRNLPDNKLPHRRMSEVELADTLICIFDYAGAFGYDIQGAFDEKMTFNAKREDHKHDARSQTTGKKW